MGMKKGIGIVMLVLAVMLVANLVVWSLRGLGTTGWICLLVSAGVLAYCVYDTLRKE